jgi:hypothetical protein
MLMVHRIEYWAIRWRDSGALGQGLSVVLNTRACTWGISRILAQLTDDFGLMPDMMDNGQ